MGKLTYMVMTIIAVQLALLFVFGQEIPGSTLWDLFTNPYLSLDSLSLWSLISDAFLAISLGVIVVGTLWIKYDILIFAGIAGVFFTFGKQLSNLWQQIASQASASGNGELTASIIVGPIIFLYIITVIEFWRGRD